MPAVFFFPARLRDCSMSRISRYMGLKAVCFSTRISRSRAIFGYINNLAFCARPDEKEGLYLDGFATINFRNSMAHTVLGRVTTSVSADSTDFFGNAIPTRDTFLSMSYGGGIKIFQQWVPLGLAPMFEAARSRTSTDSLTPGLKPLPVLTIARLARFLTNLSANLGTPRIKPDLTD